MAERNDVFRMVIRGHAVVEETLDAGIAQGFGGETPSELRRLPYPARLALFAALAPFDVPPKRGERLRAPIVASGRSAAPTRRGSRGPRDLAEAEVRSGAAGRRQGQPRHQSRRGVLVKKLVALAGLLVLVGPWPLRAGMAHAKPGGRRRLQRGRNRPRECECVQCGASFTAGKRGPAATRCADCRRVRKREQRRELHPGDNDGPSAQAPSER
jgi:hypothetical protein